MDAKKIAFSDLVHRRRLLTLLSVDDAIHRLYKGLKNQGMLDNTYIFFSSDHGYHLGQFGLAKGKSMPYESDIRVPFYALGPKVPKGARLVAAKISRNNQPNVLLLQLVFFSGKCPSPSLDRCRGYALTIELHGLIWQSEGNICV